MQSVFLRESTYRVAPRPAGPGQLRRSPIRIKYFDFALTSQGQLFYMPSDYNSYSFVNSSRDRIRSAAYSSPSRLVKIMGTDTASVRRNGRLAYNTRLYALTATGSIVRAIFDAGSATIPGRLVFRIFSTQGFRDGVFAGGDDDRMLAVTKDSRLYAFKDGAGKVLARGNYIKVLTSSYFGKIFALSSTNELFALDFNGQNPVRLMGDVKDFVTGRNGMLVTISATTNLLMKTRLGSRGTRVVGTDKADEKGTFVRFVSNTQCVVQNGNGQTFTCQVQ